MKKCLFVLMISSFAACNNSVTNNEQKVDSSYNATVDSLKSHKDSMAPSVDTTNSKSIDSIKKSL